MTAQQRSNIHDSSSHRSFIVMIVRRSVNFRKQSYAASHTLRREGRLLIREHSGQRRKWQVTKIWLKGRGGVGEGCLLIRTRRWRRTGESRDFSVTCYSCACWFTSRLNPPRFCSYCRYLWFPSAYLSSVLISEISLGISCQIWIQCGYGVASVTNLPPGLVPRPFLFLVGRPTRKVGRVWEPNYLPPPVYTYTIFQVSD